MNQLTLCPVRKNAAFTLIEVILASSLSLMTTVVMMSFFIASSKMAVESTLRSRAEMEGRLLRSYLVTDIRSACGIDDSFKSFTAGPDTLILKLPAVNESNLPIDSSSKFDRIVYHPANKNGTQVMRTIIPDAASSRRAESRAISSSTNRNLNITGMYQALPDARGAYCIYYQFASSQDAGQKTYIAPAAGSVRLRNRA